MMDLDNISTFIYTRKSLLIVFNIIVFVLWSLCTLNYVAGQSVSCLFHVEIMLFSKRQLIFKTTNARNCFWPNPINGGEEGWQYCYRELEMELW